MNPNQQTLLINQDRQAQNSLYFEHCDRLMHIVQRYVWAVADAEEVLQDSFLKIYEEIAQFDSTKGRFESWSARITVTHSLMFLRKKRNFTISMVDISEAENLFKIQDPAPFWQSDFEKISSQLTEKQALVFQLRAVEGYSFEEIKDLVGLRAEANSRKIYSLARQSLRLLLGAKKGSPILLILHKIFTL